MATVDVLLISWKASTTPYVQEYIVFVNDVQVGTVAPSVTQFIYPTADASVVQKYEVQAKDANGQTVVENLDVNVTYYPKASDIYLDQLLDVEIVDPLDGDRLAWEATTSLWKNKPQPVDNRVLVTEVRAGTNINVDSTDPTRPIVSAIASTSAGVSTRKFFTGDVVTLGATPYYKALQLDKGVTELSETNSILPSIGTIDQFDTEFISDQQPVSGEAESGIYTASIQLVSNSACEVKVSCDVNIILNNGNSAGKPLVTTLDSGFIYLTSGEQRVIPITGVIDAGHSVTAGERIKFTFFAELIGGTGGIVTLQVGAEQTGFIDIPVKMNTDTVENVSTVTGATTSDALEHIQSQVNTNISNIDKKLNSNITGEPTGAAIIGNVVQISQANYDAAAGDLELVEDTLYIIV